MIRRCARLIDDLAAPGRTSASSFSALLQLTAPPHGCDRGMPASMKGAGMPSDGVIGSNPTD